MLNLTPLTTDPFFDLIKKILQLPEDGQLTHLPLTEIFAAFNFLVMSIIVIFIIVKSVQSLMNTAHTGEALGKNNSMWTPLRVVIAVALIIPVPTFANLNTAQYLIVQSMGYSISLANQAWKIAKPVVEYPISRPQEANVNAMVNGMYNAALCQVTKANLQTTSVQELQIVTTQAQDTTLSLSAYGFATITTEQIVYGSLARSHWNCGSFKYTLPDSNADPITKAIYNNLASSITSTSLRITREVNTLVQNEGKPIFELGITSDDFNNTVKFFEQELFRSAMAGYNTTKGITPNNDTFLEAGLYVAKQNTISRHNLNALSSLPSFTDGADFGRVKDLYGRLFNQLNAIARKAETKKALKPIYSPEGMTQRLDYILNQTMYPMQRVQEIGNLAGTGISTFYAMMYGGKAAGGLIKVLLKSFEPVANVIDKSMGLLSDLQGIMTTVLVPIAFIFSVMIPNLSFIMFLLGIIIIIVKLAGALITAPIWITLSWLDFNSDSFIPDQAQKGMHSLLSLMLFPLLMVFGLIISVLMFRFVGELAGIAIFSITSLFGEAYLNVVFTVVFYGIVMLLLAYKSFELILELPDLMNEFIDSVATSGGESKSTIANTKQTTSSAGAGAGVGALPKSTPKGGGIGGTGKPLTNASVSERKIG